MQHLIVMLFKFVVPQKGNINVNIKSAFWEYFTNSAYVYSINDTSKPISKVSLSRNEDSGLGIYYYKCDIQLNSGTYFLLWNILLQIMNMF